MNIKFKMISLCTATLLTLALGGQCFAAAMPFSDLADVSAKEKILVLQEKGLVRGIADGVFAPNNTLTAAQGIQLIVNALDLNLDLVRFFKEPKATDYFPKANNDAWYANALIIASVNGLNLPAELDPDENWTREEFTNHLILAMETHKHLPMIKLIPAQIADEDQITIEYSGAIQRALVYRVVTLDGGAKFNPKAEISRADAAQQVYLALEYIAAHSTEPVNSEDGAAK